MQNFNMMHPWQRQMLMQQAMMESMHGNLYGMPGMFDQMQTGAFYSPQNQ